jgi:hypothetical protein
MRSRQGRYGMSRRTTRCNGPELAVLAPAAERARSTDRRPLPGADHGSHLESRWSFIRARGGGGGMRWVAILDDNQERASVRNEHSGAHFDYLAVNRDRIVTAAGLRPTPGEWYCGVGSGSWTSTPRDQAVRLVEGDHIFGLAFVRAIRWFSSRQRATRATAR